MGTLCVRAMDDRGGFLLVDKIRYYHEEGRKEDEVCRDSVQMGDITTDTPRWEHGADTACLSSY